MADEPSNLDSEAISGLTIEPHWGKADYPYFLTRTQTKYSRIPLVEFLNQRGIENRLLESLVEHLPKGAFIAGGFMTSVMQEQKAEGDIDLFFTGEEPFKETMKLLAEPPDEDSAWAFRGYRLETGDKGILFENGKGLRYVKYVHDKRPPIQLIKLVWYESSEHVIDSFDFTVAQFATDGEDLVFNPIGILDLARKRLVLHRMQFPSSTLRRMIKYSKKGYYACPGSLARIAEETTKHLTRYPDENGKMVYVD